MRLIVLCGAMLVSFAARGDILQGPNGTIVAVGRLTSTGNNVIHWTDCEGTKLTFSPAQGYKWKRGDDCTKKPPIGGVESDGRKWQSVPKEYPPKNP
jgi:hypothetical protein